jgi:polysaccharide pyruvyl transferase WcaK-like protein
MYSSTVKEKNTIIYSKHCNNPKENIGDTLSAFGIKEIFFPHQATKFIILPRDIETSASGHIIFGGGGMIRPNFSQRIIFQYYQRLMKTHQEYDIYGVGLNVDINDSHFSDEDLSAIGQWISHARNVTVRDVASRNFLKKICQRKIFLQPCPSFTLLQKKLLGKDAAPKKYAVGIVPSFGHTTTYQQYLDQTVRLISELVEHYTISNVLFLCHDKQDFDYMRKYLPDYNAVYISKIDDIIQHYTSVKKIITWRGHGVIFSAACKVAGCITVNINLKLKTLLEYHYQITTDTHPTFNMDYYIHKI